MSAIPLQLERYFFSKVNVEADPTCDPAKLQETKVTAQTTVHLARREDNPCRWMVKLQVSTVPAGELPIPYRVALEVIGFFSVLPDMPEAEVTNLVYMNGSALLYSAAREYLLLLTGRGPWPALQLPTTNFLSAPAVDTVAVAENMST